MKKRAEKKSKLLPIVLWILAFAVILGLVSDVTGIFKGGEVELVVEQGEGLGSVASKMRKKGIVMCTPLFKAYAARSGADTSITAGTHKMKKHMGYRAAAGELTAPAVDTGTLMLTVPEGFEIYRLAERVNESFGISKENFYAAQSDEYGYGFINEIPDRENKLEGYLFPDTYEYRENASAHDIMDKMLARFQEVWNGELSARADELGMTVDETVILASIIEREAGSEAEMGKVSSVFHNRLKIGMPLQSCATVQYILKERKDVLSIEDTKIDSPYNTYMYTGLPKGPVASPGRAALYAALYPEETNYYYFKVNSEGITVFSETLDEHNQK